MKPILCLLSICLGLSMAHADLPTKEATRAIQQIVTVEPVSPPESSKYIFLNTYILRLQHDINVEGIREVVERYNFRVINKMANLGMIVVQFEADRFLGRPYPEKNDDISLVFQFVIDASEALARDPYIGHASPDIVIGPS